MSENITNNPSVPTQIVAEVKFPQFINNLGIIPTSYKDSMDYYENVAWLCKYLQETVIPTVNQNGQAVQELQGLYIQLQEYVVHYFDNLDVQEEINNKLDKMTQDGTLTNLIGNYVDEYVTPIINTQNTRITHIENELGSVASGSPAGVYATVSALTTADPDHSKIYVVIADGKWYYYDGENWTAGGTYQATAIENFSINYQKLNPFKNGVQGVSWVDGYIASSHNAQHNEGDIDPNAYSAGYKRSTPIALTKGMTLIFKTAVTGGANALSRVNSSNQYVATLIEGNDSAGYRVRTYTCEQAYEFVCIGNITTYCSNPVIEIYDADYNLEELVNRGVHSITSSLTNGFLANASSSYAENVQVLSQSGSSTRRLTDFIKVKKGQILFTNACMNSTSIDIIGLYNEDFTFNKSVLAGYNNSNLNNNHYYKVEADGFIIITNDINLVSQANLKIELYNSFNELYNFNGYQKITPVWKNYYMSATTDAITATTNTYQTTEKIPLRKGDVISGYTISTTDGAPKIAISNGITYSNKIIINNNNDNSEYYNSSFEFNYLATADCFVEILNRVSDLTQANTEIYINPMSTAISNVYGKKYTAIGDSYIKNQNENCGHAWPSLFANKYGADYVMLGIGGTGLVANNQYGDSVLNRLSTIPLDTDFILVVGGKNDYNDQTSMQTFKDGIASIIATIQTNHPTAKLMFATPWNTYGTQDSATIKLKDYADAIEEICRKYCVPVFNSFYDSNMYMYDSTFRTNYAQASDDGSHLNYSGHKRMLERVETFLKSL